MPIKNSPVANFKPSFLSCEKDTAIILKKLFIDSKPFSDDLKKLLIINTQNCLENKTEYKEIIDKYSIAQMKEKGYINLIPKIKFDEHAEVKSFITIDYDHFVETSNPQFRDCTIIINVLCHPDYWDLGNYQLRPLKICGYIDGLLNKTKLTGIGVLNFIGCDKVVLDERLSGYTLMYEAVHGSDDLIPPNNG